MLKAVFLDRYRKSTGWVLRYAVSGPVAEVAEYKAVQMASTNRTEWPEHNGQPIFFQPLNNLLRNGQTPQPSYPLTKSFDGTRYFTDTTAQEMAQWQKASEHADVETGKLMAQMRLGINVGTIGGTPQPRPTPATTAPQGQPAGNEVADMIGQGVGTPTIGGTEPDPTPEPVILNEGTETLGG